MKAHATPSYRPSTPQLESEDSCTQEQLLELHETFAKFAGRLEKLEAATRRLETSVQEQAVRIKEQGAMLDQHGAKLENLGRKIDTQDLRLNTLFRRIVLDEARTKFLQASSVSSVGSDVKSNKQLLEEVRKKGVPLDGEEILDSLSLEMVFCEEGNDTAAHEAEMLGMSAAVMGAELSDRERRCFEEIYRYVYGTDPSLA